MNKVTPIILSGGIGSRLWPLSTKSKPKQFLKLPFDSKYNIFEQTLFGLKDPKKFNKPLIICSEEHKFLIYVLICLSFLGPYWTVQNLTETYYFCYSC